MDVVVEVASRTHCGAGVVDAREVAALEHGFVGVVVLKPLWRWSQGRLWKLLQQGLATEDIGVDVVVEMSSRLIVMIVARGVGTGSPRGGRRCRDGASNA